MGTIVARLQRIRALQDPMLQMISVLETMSPLDFLAFRDHLYPASGFQSLQWRLIENTLGLAPARRLAYGFKSYCSYLSPSDAAAAGSAEDSPTSPSLFTLVERWLERCPLLQAGEGGFSWWARYQAAVTAMLDADAAHVEGNASLSAAQRVAQREELAATRASFATLFDAAAHEALVRRGDRRLSHAATRAALLITLYCDEPLLTLPHRLLQLLVEIDEMFTAWRSRHASMVHRMLGVKMGTGGSSGFAYLKASAERHRVWGDLCDLATFLIPRAALPALPQPVRASLAFAWDAGAIASRSSGGSEGAATVASVATSAHSGASGKCPVTGLG